MGAKEIQIRSNDGNTWYTLPGGTGEFSEEAESIDDTIFGNTYSSMEVGLISWTVSANALYKGFAGYKAKLKQTGSPTEMSGEQTSQVSGKSYQIDSASRRILYRNGNVTVNDGGSPVDDSNIKSVDYLFGIVTFVDSYNVSGNVTIDAQYLPTSDLGTANTFTLTQSAETIDKTDFATAQNNEGYRVYDPGLKTVSLDLTGFYATSNQFSEKLRNRDEVIIEINPDGSGSTIARGFFKPMTHGQSGDVGAVEEETITFNLYVPDMRKLEKVFSWSHSNNSTISESVKILLDSFTKSTKPSVRYLYDGESGIEGSAVLTDVSLESSLDGINTFTADFQGDGQYKTITS